MQELTVDGRTPQQQIAECYAEVRDVRARAARSSCAELLERLADARHPHRLATSSCSPERAGRCPRVLLTQYLSAGDAAGDGPGASVSVRLQSVAEPAGHAARPATRPSRRWRGSRCRSGSASRAFCGSASTNRFVPLEDVMAHNLDLLFPGDASRRLRALPRHPQRQHRARRGRGRRSAGDDRIRAARSPLRADRAPRGPCEAWTRAHRGMLAAELGLDERADVFEVDGMLALRDLMELAALDDPALHDPPHHPIDHPRLHATSRNIFHIIRDAGSILLQHPYESFSTSVGALPARGQRRSQGARHQDDALPHLAATPRSSATCATPRATASRSRWWSS